METSCVPFSYFEGDQLRAVWLPFKKAPDYREGGKIDYICTHYIANITLEELEECFEKIRDRLDDCCIPYGAFATGKNANSNSAAYWVLKLCLDGKAKLKDDNAVGKGPFPQLPKDRPRPLEGWEKAIPDCMKDPEKKDECDRM